MVVVLGRGRGVVEATEFETEIRFHLLFAVRLIICTLVAVLLSTESRGSSLPGKSNDVTWVSVPSSVVVEMVLFFTMGDDSKEQSDSERFRIARGAFGAPARGPASGTVDRMRARSPWVSCSSCLKNSSTLSDISDADGGGAWCSRALMKVIH